MATSQHSLSNKDQSDTLFSFRVKRGLTAPPPQVSFLTFLFFCSTPSPHLSLHYKEKRSKNGVSLNKGLQYSFLYLADMFLHRWWFPGQEEGSLSHLPPAGLRLPPLLPPSCQPPKTLAYCEMTDMGSAFPHGSFCPGKPPSFHFGPMSHVHTGPSLWTFCELRDVSLVLAI